LTEWHNNLGWGPSTTKVWGPWPLTVIIIIIIIIHIIITVSSDARVLGSVGFFFKFYIAVGEFYLIFEAINVVSD
jgi:hypothetical protein